jgi:hypothetical protein
MLSRRKKERNKLQKYTKGSQIKTGFLTSSDATKVSTKSGLHHSILIGNHPILASQIPRSLCHKQQSTGNKKARKHLAYGLSCDLMGLSQDVYIMPPIPPIPPISGIPPPMPPAPFSSGISATIASVVIIRPAIEPAA